MEAGEAMSRSVSVIIPVYNRRELITATVESALAQTIPPDEIIVVDDGSTDGTREVITALAQRHPTIRLLFQENAGAGAARNRGIEAAASEWIAFLDSDDVWVPEKLANSFALVDRDPDIELVHTNWLARYPDGRTASGKEILDLNCLDCRFYLLQRFYTKTSTVVMRKSLAMRLGRLFPTDIKVFEDYEFFWRAIMAAKAIGYVRTFDMTAYQTEVSLVRSRTEYQINAEHVRAVRSVHRWIVRNGMPKEYEKLFRQQQLDAHYSVFSALTKAGRLDLLPGALLRCAKDFSLLTALYCLLSAGMCGIRERLRARGSNTGTPAAETSNPSV